MTVTYKYDADGLRTQKTVNGVVYNYGYENGKLVYERKGNEYEVIYRYDADGNLFTVNRCIFSSGYTSLLYAVNNTRGDVVALYKGGGGRYSTYTYDSWGKPVVEAIEMSAENSIRYRGYVYDQETGLYYLQSRYYDPETGRFLNADDVDYIGYSGEDVSYNAFAYCENNSICYLDSFGCAKSYCVISKIAKKINIFNEAKKIFIDSKVFKMTYTKVFVYKNKRYTIKNNADYLYMGGYKYCDGTIRLFYTGVTNLYLNKSVEGYLRFMSVEHWYDYIAEKHKTFLTRIEEYVIARYGLDGNMYEDFINALGQTTGPDFIGTLLFYRSLMKLLDSRMDKEDRYIYSIIKKFKLEDIIMILLRAEYYSYTSGKMMIIGGRLRWYKGWYLVSTKYPY